jgi:2-(3-amino-3-carboxypropyl)histidine synthase
MIANPSLEAFRYNPYDKSLTREHYEAPKMLELRRCEEEKGRKGEGAGMARRG